MSNDSFPRTSGGSLTLLLPQASQSAPRINLKHTLHQIMSVTSWHSTQKTRPCASRTINDWIGSPKLFQAYTPYIFLSLLSPIFIANLFLVLQLVNDKPFSHSTSHSQDLKFQTHDTIPRRLRAKPDLDVLREAALRDHLMRFRDHVYRNAYGPLHFFEFLNVSRYVMPMDGSRRDSECSV